MLGHDEGSPRGVSVFTCRIPGYVPSTFQNSPSRLSLLPTVRSMQQLIGALFPCMVSPPSYVDVVGTDPEISGMPARVCRFGAGAARGDRKHYSFSWQLLMDRCRPAPLLSHLPRSTCALFPGDGYGMRMRTSSDPGMHARDCIRRPLLSTSLPPSSMFPSSIPAVSVFDLARSQHY